MNNTIRTILIALAVVLASVALFYAGFAFASTNFERAEAWEDARMGAGMMSGYSSEYANPFANGMGMMGGGMMGGSTMGGMMDPGSFSSYSGDPISLEQAEEAVGEYLAAFGNEDLILGEIMVFENHAYAQIVEESTGIGAMEVLIDPATLSIYPEFGPNMMWNAKYGMMGTGGMMGMGGMMGFSNWQNSSGEMTISDKEAVELAQQYLDNYSPDLTADEHVDPFYGYYTMHILDGDETVGMLSVHGQTGQVFPHHWHGALVAMAEGHD